MNASASGRGGTLAGVLLTALAALSWSTAGLFPRVVSTDVFTTLFWRSLLGGLSVLALQALLERGGPRRWRLSMAEAAMAVASSGAMLCFIAAFYFTRVADVVFIYSAFPVITLLLSALLLGSVVRRIDIACSATVVLGMALIVQGQASLHNLLGAALSLGATLLFALITIGIRRYPEAGMLTVSWCGALIATLAMAPFAQWQTTSLHDMAWLGLYGFLNVGVGFGLYLLGARRLTPVLAALVCMLEIPLAPLWVWLFFGETVPQASLAGGAVIVAAVLVNALAAARPGPPAAHG